MNVRWEPSVTGGGFASEGRRCGSPTGLELRFKVGVKCRLVPRDRSSCGRTLGVVKAFAYLTVVVLALIALGVGVSASRWEQRPSRGRARRSPKLSEFNGLLSFEYPSSWTANTYPEPLNMFASPVVFLSNEAMHAPCVTNGSTVTCSFPLTRLGSGGVLVEWSTIGHPGWTLAREPGRPISVHGHPGRESLVSGQGSCVSGTQEDITLVMVTEANIYEMDACLRGPDLARERSEIQAMIASTKIFQS